MAQIEERSRSQRARTGRRWLAVALLAPALLAGCTDLDMPPAPTVPGVARTARPSPTPTATASPIVAEHVVSPLPNPSRVYFTQGGDLWQLPVDNLAAPVVSGSNLLAFAPAPDGERVAIARQTESEDAQQRTEGFAIVNADSTVAQEVSAPEDAGSGPESVQSLAWSPDGASLALLGEHGAIVIAGIDGHARVLSASAPAQASGALQWSPDGRTLSYLDPQRRGAATSLYTVDVATGDRRPVVLGSEQAPVRAAVWLPGRGEIAYVLGSPSGFSVGGDLFTIAPGSDVPTLLMSAGHFAPVGGIAAIAAAADGQRLAFTVFVPGDPHPVFQSLWVMDLGTRAVTEVPVAVDQSVTDLWWAGERLFYRALPVDQVVVPATYTGTEPFTLMQYDPQTGEITERYRP